MTYSFFLKVIFLSLSKNTAYLHYQKHTLEKKGPVNFTGLDDKTSYQTVFAKNYGSIAAPTAGLHFSDELLKKIATKIPIEKITLL